MIKSLIHGYIWILEPLRLPADSFARIKGKTKKVFTTYFIIFFISYFKKIRTNSFLHLPLEIFNAHESVFQEIFSISKKVAFS